METSSTHTPASLTELTLTAQEGDHTWYWKPSQLPRAGEGKDLRRERTTATLLDKHSA